VELIRVITFDFSWLVVVPCTAGSRLLLNMREQYFVETALWQNTSQTALDKHNDVGNWSHTMAFATVSPEPSRSLSVSPPPSLIDN
jgi:hypothetical protein